MRKPGRNKLIAFGITFLLVASTLIGYAILNYKPATADPNSGPLPQTMVTTTDNSTPSTTIKAGPTQGYEPLAVHFYANPTNDTNIVAYHWKFGPVGYIIPQDNYNAIFNRPYNKLLKIGILCTLLSFIVFPSVIGNMNIPTTIFMTTWWGVVIAGILNGRAMKKNIVYESTARDPTMVFVRYGSYSATLTATYTNGSTTSETTWITVFQYVPPDVDHNDALTRLQEMQLRHYISRRT